MYRQAAADGGVGAYLTNNRGNSILPDYTQVGAADTSANAVDVAADITPTVRQGNTEWAEIDRRKQSQNKASIQASLLFIVGLSLGYIWGGTTK